VTKYHIGFNLAALGVLIAFLGIIYWQHTGARAVPGLIEELQGTDTQAQVLAAMHLGQIGLAAKPAVPALVLLARSADSYVSSTAAGALPTIDLSAAREVMVQYRAALGDTDPQIRRNAAGSLAALGPLAKPAVPALLQALGDSDDLVRDRATRALGQIGIPEREVTAGLLRSLRDPVSFVRHTAMSQLSFGGVVPPEALPILREVTKDADRQIAQLAANALAREEHPIEVSTLLMSLDTDGSRIYTLQQLARLGPRAVEAVPSLIPLLMSEQPLDRYLAVVTLDAIGPSAKEAERSLRQALDDREPVVREAAADALRAIGTNMAPPS
jgi:HEAT repeat protein